MNKFDCLVQFLLTFLDQNTVIPNITIIVRILKVISFMHINSNSLACSDIWMYLIFIFERSITSILEHLCWYLLPGIGVGVGIYGQYCSNVMIDINLFILYIKL